MLARYSHLEDIPDDASSWEDVRVRGALRLAGALAGAREEAALFRDLATLRTTLPVFGEVDELCWKGPESRFFDVCARFNAPGYYRRAQAAASARA